jgi:hypothetical protein
MPQSYQTNARFCADTVPRRDCKTAAETDFPAFFSDFAQ